MKATAFTVLLALTILTAPLVADAQQLRKVYRIGILAGSSQALNWQPIKEALQQGLRELGYVEGQNVSMEYRYTEGNVALLPELAADLVRRNVDIIVVGGYAMALAAKQATTTIPIVGVFAQRPKKVHFSNTPLLWQGTPLHNPLMSQ
jgi:putative ABC transport system substrate-binding protein